MQPIQPSYVAYLTNGPISFVRHLMKFLPTLTEQSALNDVMRSLLSLPACLGGMGVLNPVLEAHAQYKASLYITTRWGVSLLINHPLSPSQALWMLSP